MVDSLSRKITTLILSAALVGLPCVSFADDAIEPKNTDLSIGISPHQPKATGSDTADETPPVTVRTSVKNWEFGFHGYLRAPLVMSFDTHQVNTYPTDENGVPDRNQTPIVLEDWRFNTAAALPDSSYEDWTYTNNMYGPWGELLFSFGNAVAQGNVSIAAYNITDAGWRNLQSQLGINQAFVTLNFPRAFGTNGGLIWNVGAFGNRYGGTGRYDAGRYDTYIFGQTHIAGETLTAQLRLTDKLGLVLEHGFGAKSDAMPGNPKDDMDLYNRNSSFSWMPYAGTQGQIPAMVNHAHAGLVFQGNKLFQKLTIAGHFLHAFTASADTTNNLATWPYAEKNGKQMIGGAEFKTEGAIFGDVYLGFSTMETDGLSRMPDAVELLHSQGGWGLLNNFYGDMVLRESGDCKDSRANCPNPGTGRIITLAWQYDLSLARLLWFSVGRHYFGQAPDLTLSTFGMINLVNPDDKLEPYLKRWAKRKMKYGWETIYTPIPYIGFGLRYDRVIPDMDYDQSAVDYNETASYSSYAPFSVLSPKLTLKTAFSNREEVTIQYSHYFWEKSGLTEDQYRNAVRMATSNGRNQLSSQSADRNALMISVTMWW